MTHLNRYWVLPGLASRNSRRVCLCWLRSKRQSTSSSMAPHTGVSFVHIRSCLRFFLTVRAPCSRCDDVCGVSESIITGTPIPLGTGMFRLLQVHQLELACVTCQLTQLSQSETKEAAGRPSAGWSLHNNEYHRYCVRAVEPCCHISVQMQP